jgi:hypothetical protein
MSNQPGEMQLSPEAIQMFKSGEISAVLTRADGTVVDLGALCSFDNSEPETAPAPKPTILQKIGASLWPKS